MIMKRPDSDDDRDPVFGDLPSASGSDIADSRVSYERIIPGLLYRGVPQDQRRRNFRIDSIGAQPAPLAGPAYIVSRKSARDMNLTELFFG